MHTLIVEVLRLPDETDLPIQAMSAYPQLLEEDMQLWRRTPVLRCEDLYQAVKLFTPAVIVFLGPQALTAAWCRVSEQLFPQLFAMGHPPAVSETVLDAVFVRTRLLRAHRLAQRPVRVPGPMQTDLAALQALVPGLSPEKLQACLSLYQLNPLLNHLGTEVVARGLYCLALLKSHLTPLVSEAAVLDIGCHLWSYAPFLRVFQEYQGTLTGVELDPWYLQADGLSRADWARYYAGLAQATYLVGQPGELDLPKQDLITLFLPLVLADNARRWGLPAELWNPAGLFAQVRRLLRPQGQVLLYHGVQLEYDASLEILHHLNWLPLSQGRHFCPIRQEPQGYFICLGL